MTFSNVSFNSWIVFPVVLIGWIFSLCLHEFAHALTAYIGGDTTVRDKGYLSFNPLRYVNVQFSIVMPLVFLLLGGIGLPGGAVYINRGLLRAPWWGSLVSLAGPFANLVLAFALGFWFRALPPEMVVNSWGAALAFLAFLQVSAVVLNLLPVPGLDGFGIISPFLPPAARQKAALMGSGAMLLLLALFFIPGANRFFWSSVAWLTSALGVPYGLSIAGLLAFRFWA